MEFVVSSANPARQKTGALVLPVFDRRKLSAAGRTVDEATGGRIKAVLASGDFDGKAGVEWEILNPLPKNLSYQKRKGMLTVATDPGSFHGGAATHKNVFLIDNPAEDGRDFRITARVVDFHPTKAYQQATLVCWNDAANYIKLAYECGNDDATPRLTAIGETAEDASNRTDFPGITHDGELWLRMTKCGSRYYFSFSIDGKTFHEKGSLTWGNGQPEQLGFTACRPNNPNVPEIDAHFDYVEVEVAQGTDVTDSVTLSAADVTLRIAETKENAGLYFQRADLFARHGRWKQAAADLQSGLEQSPDDRLRLFQAAILHCYLNNEEEYKTYCNALVEKFGSTDDWHAAEMVAKPHLIAAEVLNREEAIEDLTNHKWPIGSCWCRAWLRCGKTSRPRPRNTSRSA